MVTDGKSCFVHSQRASLCTRPKRVRLRLFMNIDGISAKIVFYRQFPNEISSQKCVQTRKMRICQKIFRLFLPTKTEKYYEFFASAKIHVRLKV
jgi:hypothetical protein